MYLLIHHIPPKIPGEYFLHFDKLILKSVRKGAGPKDAKIIYLQ